MPDDHSLHDMSSPSERELSDAFSKDSLPDAFLTPPGLDRLRFTDDWQPSTDLPDSDLPAGDKENDLAVAVHEWVRDTADSLPRKHAQQEKQQLADLWRQKTEEWKKNAASAKQWVLEHPRQDLCFGLAFLLLVLVIALAVASHRMNQNKNPAHNTEAVTEAVEEISEAAARPDNGLVLYNRYAALSVALTVENNTDKDCYVMTWAQGVTAQELYIRAGSSATFSAPMGTYHVYIATGDTWQSTDALFGAGTKYYTRSSTLYCALNSDVTLTIPADFSGYTQYANGWLIGR